jgi:hypothetical protein
MLAIDETEDLPHLQKTFSGGQTVLPELSRAIHLESGIVGKHGLSADDVRAARFSDFILAVFLFRDFYALNLN